MKMEAHSHGHEALGANKESGKIYNPELKDGLAPPSSQIPTAEDFTIAPSSEGLVDVHKKDPDSAAAPATEFSFPLPPSDLSNTLSVMNFQPYDVAAIEQNCQHEIPQVGEQEEAFDDMVMLENGMVTSASLPGGQELFQDPDIQMEEFQVADILNPTSVAPEDCTIEVTLGEQSGISPVDLPTEAPGIAESEVAVVSGVPAAPVEVLDELTSSPAVDSSGVQLLDVEQLPTPDVGGMELPDAHPATDAAAEGDTLQMNEPGGESNEVTEEDIKAIKGQKVIKKFGRKNFQGEVVNYDPETKWFKVVYEDGDEEDLELWEVKMILPSSSSASSSSKKRPCTEGGADKSSQKSSKKSKKFGAETTAKKKAKDGAKSNTKSPKTPGSRAKSSKKSSASKTAKPITIGKSIKKVLDSTALKTPENSEVKEVKGKGSSRNAKRGFSSDKKKTGERVSKSLSLQSPKTEKKEKSTGSKKTPSKAAKTEDTPKLMSGLKRKAELQETAGSKTKRSKAEESIEKGDTTCIGKHVKKEFGGNMYNGVVVKFDKKTQFFKVKYEDGDQEDLELHELEPILVQQGESVENEKPTKTSSLASLMSEEKKS